MVGDLVEVQEKSVIVLEETRLWKLRQVAKEEEKKKAAAAKLK